MLYTVFLGLVGALCWGIAPVFGKLGLRDIHPMDGLAVRTAVTLVFILVWVLGTGGASRISGISTGAVIFLGIEAFLATLAGDLAYYAALKWGSVSVAAAVLAASPVITVWAGRAFLEESLSPLQSLGILLVGAGILLVSLGGPHT